MARSLLIAAVAFAFIASGSGEGSFSEDSSGVAPYDPAFRGGCKWGGEKDGMITSLLTYAQGDAITVEDDKTKTSYEFTPCRRQVGLGKGCTQDESRPVSTTAGLVIRRDGKCEAKRDILFATTEPKFQDNAWLIDYTDLDGMQFSLNITCEQGATNKFLANGAKFLRVADQRACPVNATTVAPFNVSADACAATFDDSKMVTELNTFASWFTGTFVQSGALPNVYINTCGTRSFSDSSYVKGCGSTEGYVAFTEGNDCVVLDQRVATFYPDGEFGQYWVNHYYAEKPKTTTGHEFEAQAETEIISRDVVVSCGPETGSYQGKSADGKTLYFTSKGACGAAPTPAPMTDAPSQQPKSGLTTGEVVGIVIGALALIVIILVCLRWRSAKGEEEGEYERV